MHTCTAAAQEYSQFGYKELHKFHSAEDEQILKKSA
jgi:hypothetical protein